MSAGDKEIILASEETQRRNITTVIQHGNESRKMIKELGAIIDALQNQVIIQSKQLQQMKMQLAAVQQQLYANGTQHISAKE
jgi:hypothetical protein